MIDIQPKSLLRRGLGALYRLITKREYLQQQFRGHNERAVEYAFVFQNVFQACPKTVLDVGTGITALPQLIRTCGPVVTAIDNISDYWPKGMFNRHYYVRNESILHPKISETFDMITCISTLEHIDDFDLAITSMFQLLNPGGRLVLSFPYCETEFVDNVYALPGSIGATSHPFKTRAFSRREIARWSTVNNARVVTQQYWRFFTGQFWTLGEMIVPPVPSEMAEQHQISCVTFEKLSQ
jgi:2-polyprenyl-3-methyl-5-hydroxy-6-metoxy-1,4-benzoquinol methylase